MAHDEAGGVTLATRGAGSATDEAARAENATRCSNCGQWTSQDAAHECPMRSAPAVRFDEVMHKVELANRKLARQGIPGRFEVEIVGRWTESRIDDNGRRSQREMVDYRLNRPEVSVPGWTFVGRLDILGDGTPIALCVPDVELHGYRPESQRCDHCGTNRRRTKTYLLRGDDGAIKQVGSNCLEAFTGIEPKGLWTVDHEFEQDDIDDVGYNSGWETTATPTEVLRMALTLTDNGRSYVSKDRAYWEQRASSASTINTFVFPDGLVRGSEEFREVTQQANSPETVRLADEVLEYARTMDGEADYPTNLRALARQDAIGSRHVGLLASAVASWHRDKERRAREAAEAATPKVSEWVGQQGAKISAVPARVVGVRFLDGQYGTTTLLTMQDDKGRTLKWFASKALDVQEGAQITIDTATIKNLDVYQGQKQTLLTRTKFTVLSATG